MTLEQYLSVVLLPLAPEAIVVGAAAKVGARLAPGAARLVSNGVGKLRNAVGVPTTAASKEAPRLLGPGTNFGKHVRLEKLAERGWTERLVRSTIDDPVRTVPTRDYRKIPGAATRMDDPATAYYGPRGGYVVRNNRTGDVVQISDRLDPYWKAPWDR